MKKHVFTALLFAAATTTSAQITVSQGDGPIVGQVVITATDTLYTGSTGTSGTNQTWNMTAIMNHIQDTVSFISPSGQPGSSSFGSSNLCIASIADSTWIYLTNNAAGLTIDGYYVADQNFGLITLKYSPARKMLNYSSTYNSSFVNTAKTSFKAAYNSAPIDSVQLREQVDQNSIVDGWGSLTTNTGTYNALRQNVTEITTDSIFLHAFGVWTYSSSSVDTSITYRWWANGLGYPVLEIPADGSGAVNGRSTYLVSTSVGINEISSNQLYVLVYPNPARDIMNIETNLGKRVQLTMSDVSGRVVYQTTLGNRMQIDMSSFNNGQYFYRCVSENGYSLDGKIILAR